MPRTAGSDAATRRRRALPAALLAAGLAQGAAARDQPVPYPTIASPGTDAFTTTVVPGEIIYDHLASVDKTYATVEGASHGSWPRREEAGDTVTRTFDFIDRWTRRKGLFGEAGG